MILQSVRAWLNGNRDYNTGVAIYALGDCNKNLLKVLQLGRNDFRAIRLQEELIAIYDELNGDPANHLPEASNVPYKPQTKSTAAPVNQELYEACKLTADDEYKRIMNMRAVLVSMANGEGWEDINLEHKISDRAKMAIDVVQGFQKVSQLYDKADYAKLHGRLPSGDEDEKESEYDHLPDSLVKLRLDNARKAYNKLKKKEPTPERIQLLQQHEQNIKKLEDKWHSLRVAQ